MEPFHYHVFICDQQKPEGVPGCAARGSAKVMDALRGALAAAGLQNEVQVTTCGSLGLCEWGPNMVVYPDGVWYSGVSPSDIQEIVNSHFKEGRVVERLAKTDPAVLHGEVCKNRDHYLAGLRAKDAAGSLPDPLTQTVRGYQESRVILTAIELDIFSAVGNGAAAAQVAEKIQADARATAMLLDALAAMDLLVKSGDSYANSPVAARFLASGGPDSWRQALMHTVSQWKRWSTLTDAVRRGTAVGHEEMAERGDDWARAFISAMHRNALERAPLVVNAAGASRVKRMLDVGGGSGAYSIAFAQANPELHADILDLDVVIALTRDYIEQAGLGDRIHTRAGDLRTDALGSGYDLVFISAICHMLNEAENEDLLRRAHTALSPNGRVVIQDFILDADRTTPRSAALFSLNMLVSTEAGSSYSEPEYAEWLKRAGFESVQRVRLPGPTGLMLGSRR